MRAEASATLAEASARLGDGIARHDHRPRFHRHVREPYHLARLLTFVGHRLVDNHHELALAADPVAGKLGDFHPAQRKRRVHTVERRDLESSNFCIEEVRWRWFVSAFQELLSIDDLKNAALASPVAEIDPIALRAH